MTEELQLEEIVSDLKKFGEATEEEISQISNLKETFAGIDVPSSLTDENNETIRAEDIRKLSKEGEEDSVDIRTMLKNMLLPQKIKLAMFGNAACRNILILDSNKMIQLCVLKNPKLGMKEVTEFSRNTNIAQLVLRTISEKKEWMKSYDVKYNIVVNPKTPSDIALKWLRYVTPGDLKLISKSKNLPQVVSMAAKKKLNDLEANKGGH